LPGTGVDTLRRFYELWNSGDVEALSELFDENAVVRPALSAFLASTIYRGRDGIAAWYAETNEPWTDLTVEPEEISNAGDQTLGIVRVIAHARGSTVDLETRIAHVAVVRSGRIVRLDGYEEPSEARSAVAREY
jgi:ketosteroid isomerase-like protein